MNQKSSELLIQEQAGAPPRLLLLFGLYGYVPGHAAVIVLQNARQLLHGLAALFAGNPGIQPMDQRLSTCFARTQAVP